MKKLRFLALATALALTAALAGCSKITPEQTQAEQAAPAQTEQTQPQQGQPPRGGFGKMGGFGSQEVTQRKYAELHADYSDRDLSGEYNESEATRITLTGSGADIIGAGASAENSVVTITQKGVYIISGTLNDGRVLVTAPDDEKIQLVLAGASITSSDGPALHITQCDKVFVTLADGTQNTLADGAEYASSNEEKAPDAALFSRADTTINGTGALAVTANYNDGIVSKDDLIIVNAKLTVAAPNHGVVGKDLLALKDVDFDITAGKDALKSDNEDSGKGNLIIDSGSFKISADDDGISSETDVFIYGGSISISKSTEGIEGSRVSILGGNIDICASDDGINASAPSSSDSAEQAAGPRMGSGMQNEPDTYIRIAGGTIYVKADSDCVDSNGDIIQTGGTLLTSGPAQGDGSPLDPNGGSAIFGGYTAAAGGQMMTSNFGASSTQSSIMISFSSTQTGSTRTTLCDAAGNALLSFAPENDYSLIIFSSPELKTGEAYTLYTGGECEAADGYAFAANTALSGGTRLCGMTLTKLTQSFTDSGEEANGMTGFGRGGRQNQPQ